MNAPPPPPDDQADHDTNDHELAAGLAATAGYRYADGVGDVRHLTIYVVGEHHNLLDAWRAVTEWFAAPVPPATLLGVNLLGHRDHLVEIDATIRRHPDAAQPVADETMDRPHAS